jgi:hypothetical protein
VPAPGCEVSECKVCPTSTAALTWPGIFFNFVNLGARRRNVRAGGRAGGHQVYYNVELGTFTPEREVWGGHQEKTCSNLEFTYSQTRSSQFWISSMTFSEDSFTNIIHPLSSIINGTCRRTHKAHTLRSFCVRCLLQFRLLPRNEEASNLHCSHLTLLGQ